MEKSEIWNSWCRAFERVEQELYGALHARWMWRALSAILAQAEIKQHPTLVNYLSHTYAATVCTFVRRHASDGRHDAGLLRCIRLLSRHPEIATRTLYAQRGSAAHGALDWNESRGFDAFAPNGGETIERPVMEASIKRLAAAASPVKKYVDVTIAHTSHTVLLAPVDISFVEIDHALDEVEAVVKQYFGIRYPGTMLAFGTPIPDLSFLRMFEQPWFPVGSTLPAALDAQSF